MRKAAKPRLGLSGSGSKQMTMNRGLFCEKSQKKHAVIDNLELL
jgi:hypothetical protein